MSEALHHPYPVPPPSRGRGRRNAVVGRQHVPILASEAFRAVIGRGSAGAKRCDRGYSGAALGRPRGDLPECRGCNVIATGLVVPPAAFGAGFRRSGPPAARLDESSAALRRASVRALASPHSLDRLPRNLRRASSRRRCERSNAASTGPPSLPRVRRSSLPRPSCGRGWGESWGRLRGWGDSLAAASANDSTLPAIATARSVG